MAKLKAIMTYKIQRQNIRKPHILLPVIVAILMTPVVVVSAVTLPDAFDEPCMGGMGIIADICIAVNLLNDEQKAQEIRIADNENAITTLTTIQILEQIEQDTQGVQLNSLEAQVAAIPEILLKVKLDNNGLPCSEAGGVGIQPDWCAGQGGIHNVQDADVTPDSFVAILYPTQCGVQAQPTDGAFIIFCSVGEGFTLRYIVVN